jgi:MoxR-like ATPase
MIATREPRGGVMSDQSASNVAWFSERFELIVANLAQAIQGKHEVLRQALVCVMAEGHLLVEDVPGVGKTTLSRAIARSIEGRSSRIQFTPDLLPSDVTGASVYNASTNAFEFRAGPVFANIVVGDEINRASPKTQSALLEVMEERQVTVDGQTYGVPRPFSVMATQNPIEYDGTYRLPEAQIDRFLMKISVGYPDVETEAEILELQGSHAVVDDLPPVTNLGEVRAMLSVASQVYGSPSLRHYISSLSAATRTMPDVLLGVSPRGSLALLRAGRAVAAAQSRTFVSPDDIQRLVPAVFGHRIVLKPEAEAQGAQVSDVINTVLQSVPVPQQVR